MAKATKAKAREMRSLSAKVTEKGGVSLYGLQRFPVTLYADQWLDILDQADSIRAFIAANKSKLKDKPAEGSNVSGTTAL